MATQLGKRYICSVCGTEVLCTKASSGQLTCCGTDMHTKEMKQLPSVD